MRKNEIRPILLTILFICIQIFGQENNYWIKKCDSTNVDSCGYVNNKGEVKIPFGKYPICFTDTMYNYAIVFLPETGFVAIDRQENVLFKIFPFDNGPDYPQQGMFRIIKNGKIGFANLEGKIVIPPIFDAVLPFENGLAAFCVGCDTVKYDENWAWENGKWGFINLKGEIISKPQFNRIWNNKTRQFEYIKDNKNNPNDNKISNDTKNTNQDMPKKK